MTVILWWMVWMGFGFVGWIWIRNLFNNWVDQGYIFGKIAGVILVSFLTWLLGMAKLVPFGVGSILLSTITVIVLGWRWDKKLNERKIKINWLVVGIEELAFLVLLVVWSFVKGHEPNINGLEKFMDFGIMKSILESRFFPPADMWFAGKSINYYYFGHLYVAVLTKISGINLVYTFNLMLSTLFALTGVMGGAIAYKILTNFKPVFRVIGVIITSYILLFGGNLHTIYAFTKGYTGDNPPPFWQIWGKVPDSYWYPNATRFIPFTIHEFPAYSFIVSDIHGHVLDIPIVLLLIGLLIVLFVDNHEKNSLFTLGLFGFSIGCAFMTNALDALVYLGLFGLLGILSKVHWKKLLLTIIIIIFTVLPFVTTFKSFVNGVAVNCPPVKLANSRFGPLVFEEVSKCQKSPIWMMLILWGLFVYGGVWLSLQREKRSNLEIGMLWISIYCLGLIIFPEFFYFRDIYPMHFRSNTMFKLGYQVFILMTFVTVYTLTKAIQNGKKQIWGIVGIVPLLYLVFIYPRFSIKSYFGDIRWDNYKGLNGVTWIKNNYPDNYAVMNWIARNIPSGTQPVILEANGDSYTDYNMFSAFTGLPTVAGWTVHEWLWREGYTPIANRAEEVRKIYEDGDIQESLEFLNKYQVKYIVISNFEKEKYPGLNIYKINQLAKPVFTSGDTTLYIEVGMKIVIPKLESSGNIKSYTVQEGDNLWKIAVEQCGSGYMWSDIAVQNNLQNPRVIHAGDVLEFRCEVR